MSEIFISHIHEDEYIASALALFLQSKLPATDVFVSSDQFRVRLGDDWQRKVRDALRAAKAVLAIFSPESVGRPWVNFEAGGAWFSEGKVLIPLCIGMIRPETLPKPYSNIQGAHLADAATLSYLVSTMWERLKLPGLQPVPFRDKDTDVAGFLAAVASWQRWRQTPTE
jgi:hypothetical protein